MLSMLDRRTLTDILNAVLSLSKEVAVIFIPFEHLLELGVGWAGSGTVTVATTDGAADGHYVPHSGLEVVQASFFSVVGILRELNGV